MVRACSARISQAEYDEIDPKSASTLYIVEGT